MSVAQLPGTGSGQLVRVARNGNSKTLAIPAEVARLAGIEPGDGYVVTQVGNSLVYRRVDHHGADIRGEGTDRHAVLARGAVVPVGEDPAPSDPLDWDDI